MSAVTTIEMRLQIELQRRYLSRPEPLPAALQADLSDYPALLARHRWGTVRAVDLVGLLQPWTERDANPIERGLKVAGARHVLLLGLVDEPWVQVLVDSGGGRLSLWRDRQTAEPLLTIIGSDADLVKLEAPRTAHEIERVLRRGSSLTRETDWMLRSVFGVDQHELARWLNSLATDHPAASLALIRRDVAAALDLLSNERERLAMEVKRNIHALRILFEIMRLVELLRAGAGPGRTTADALFATLATVNRTINCLQHDTPRAAHITDGWMFMSTLEAFGRYRGTPLSPAFPLTAYRSGASQVSAIAIDRAIQDSATFEFYSAALLQADAIAGTSRTLVRIEGEQPVDFFCGVEQMRLAVVALRAMARKSGHSGALNYANRAIVGRLALHLLRVTDPAAFNAYAEHWSNTYAVKSRGLTRRDLELGLTDPDLAHDLVGTLVIKTEQIRKFVAVASESDFDPYWWSRKPQGDSWASYHTVARGDVGTDKDDGQLSRDLLRNVAALGTRLPEYFESDAGIVAEAVSLCSIVGAHHTPLARDPTLFAIALRRSAEPLENSLMSNVKLRIVPRARRKIVRLARRGVGTPSASIVS